MSTGTRKAGRLNKELKQLLEDPPYGISCFPVADHIDQFEATITGPKGTCYEEGCFRLKVSCPDRYPFEPPDVKFITPVYHPNIDHNGRICLDQLKQPPSGTWSPIMNVQTVLTSIRLLLENPNPDDPLVSDIASEYSSDRATFMKKAREHIKKYSRQNPESSGTGKSSDKENQTIPRTKTNIISSASSSDTAQNPVKRIKQVGRFNLSTKKTSK